MAVLTHTVVVGEDGGYSVLNGTVENSAMGIERNMVAQRRSGYIARVEDDGNGGMKLVMIKELNSPQTPFEDVEKNFLGKQRSKGSSNNMFSGWGHRRIGGPR